MKEEKELIIEQETIKDCPILFDMVGRPYDETCMCFGFECGKGWHEAISNACREMELLNWMYYPKYRVRIQADQIKEKFGELRFYYSVVHDPGKIRMWFANKFRYINEYLSQYKKFDYKMKKVIDIEPYYYDTTTEISKEEYEKHVNSKYKPSNVKYIVKDGVFQNICHLYNSGKWHLAPTRLKLLWYLKELSRKMYYRLKNSCKDENSAIRNCKYVLDVKANEIIRKAELECSKTCEDCGSQIGTDWSPACMTTGWITYICSHCAEKHNGTYIKNDELWQGNKMLKSKEEMQKNRKESRI